MVQSKEDLSVNTQRKMRSCNWWKSLRFGQKRIFYIAAVALVQQAGVELYKRVKATEEDGTSVKIFRFVNVPYSGTC